MCCHKEVYKCCNSDVISVVNVYLYHLKFSVVCIIGQRDVNVTLTSLMSPPPLLCDL